MGRATPSLRLNFQAKVLLPVLSFLILLPAVTVWIVDRHITQQALHEAQQTLNTAEAVFRNSLGIRAQNLLSRHRNAVNDPRFKAVAKLADPRTMTVHLNEMIEEFGGEAEILVFTTRENKVLASAHRGAPAKVEEFGQSARLAVAEAIQGRQGLATVPFEAGIFNVVSLPVLVGDQLEGALTVGIRIAETAVQELKSLTRTEILLFSESQSAVSTLPSATLRSAPMEPLRRLATGNVDAESIVLDGEHYLALGSPLDRGSSSPFSFLLLSPYERRLRALEATRRTLIWISAVGVLLSSGVVWVLIRRITRPILELRDSAEAVGRGDFSRRIAVRTGDECGELAGAFNQMTANLQNSRAELEKAVASLHSTQAQLVQSEKLSAVGQFVAGVTHELNNPLTSVIGFSELLHGGKLNEPQQTYAKNVFLGAQRCQKIVQNLLSFSRQHPPERKLVNVNELIDGVLDILGYELRTSNVEVVRELAPDLPKTLADAHQLQQVFLNILNNARQAIDPFRRDGRLVIATRAPDSCVRIEFHDNGPGISREHLSRIFDPFFTTKPLGKGTGLGLSVSYGIIREHGGKISAQSQPGQGAVFIIELPAARGRADDDPTARVAADVQAPGSATVGRRVLVIDDEQWILDLVREVLKADGCHVDAVQSGQEGLEAVARGQYDAILCDWKMPGLNGPQLFERLAQQQPEAVRRFVFMTGDVINESFQQFLRTHGRPCLPKPFSLQEFRAIVAKTVQLKNGGSNPEMRRETTDGPR